MENLLEFLEGLNVEAEEASTEEIEVAQIVAKW